MIVKTDGSFAALLNTQEVYLAGPGDGPHLHDGGAQLEVGLVHLRALPHVDLQVVADEGEEGGGEAHPPLLVDGHVHPDEALVGHLVRTLLPEPERRVDVLQQLQRLGVVNSAPGGMGECK